MRDNWWHLVAYTPVAVALGGLIGGAIGALLVLTSVPLYPVAVWRDAAYVRETTDGDGPNVKLCAALGVAGLLTLGLGSYLVSPYYLYRRRQYTN